MFFVLTVKGEFMRRFDLYLPEELFNRIELLADFYNISKTKMIVHLLEIGYIKEIEK